MNTPHANRIDWVDYAKGFCIVMVVMMHSTLGVEQAAGREGWMHAVVAFARPFRMPDFFLISGLFLARVIDRDWRDYLDRKVVHFAYFYVLWVTIQFAFKAPMFAADMGWRGAGLAYLEAFIEPFGTLWFIYLLPIFFVVVKAHARPAVARDLARRRGAGDRPHRHRLDRDRRVRAPLRLFLHRLHLRAAHLRARRPRAAQPMNALAALVGLGHRQWRAGARRLRRPAVRLAGARAWPAPARWSRSRRCSPTATCSSRCAICGQNSIVIYLAFFLPMAATRIVAAQDRHHHRPRHGLADRHGRRRRRRAGLVLGGARHAVPLPVRAAGLGAAQARARCRPCSRRNDSQRPLTLH